MIDDAVIKRWEKEYIDGLNVRNRNYTLLNTESMKEFIKKNYYDSGINRYVTGKSDTMLFGLQYIDYACKLIYGDNVKYLICTTTNNKGTNTILSDIVYHEDCTKVVEKQLIPVTLVEYLEVNSYFRGLGLSKEILGVFADVAPEDRMILTTTPSLLGSKSHAYDTLKECLLKNGFKNDMRTLAQIDENYTQVLQGKEFTLKKTYK